MKAVKNGSEIDSDNVSRGLIDKILNNCRNGVVFL